MWAVPAGKFLHRKRLANRSEVGYARLRAHSSPQVLQEARSKHHNGLVRVIRYGPWLALRFNETEQGLTFVGEADTEEWRDGAALPQVLGFEYLRVMASAAAGFASLNGVSLSAGARVLCVGLGAGALSAFVAHHSAPLGAEVQVVELDPLVIQVVRDTLRVQFEQLHSSSELLSGAPRSRAHRARAPFTVLQSDAGPVLAELAAEVSARRAPGVDLIYLDAYEEHAQVPKHLKAADFLTACRQCLSANGIIVVNLFNSTPNSRPRREMADYARLLSEHVGCVYSVKVEEQQTNVVLVAARRESPLGCSVATRGALEDAARAVATQQRWEFDAGDLVQKMFHCRIRPGGLVEVVPGRVIDFPKESSASDSTYYDREEELDNFRAKSAK